MNHHPYADLFPLLEGTEFNALVEDIKAHGLHEPIVTHEDMILEGRNRQRACEAARVEPKYVPLPEGTDPLNFVISKNLHRRHLSTQQRAMVAAELANLRRGERADRVEGSIDLSTAAKLVGVSEPSVKRARVVALQGAPELKDAVRKGQVSIDAAATVAKLPAERQRELVANHKVKDEVARSRAERSLLKRRRRGQRPNPEDQKKAEERAKASRLEHEQRAAESVAKLIKDIGIHHARLVYSALSGSDVFTILKALQQALEAPPVPMTRAANASTGTTTENVE